MINFDGVPKFSSETDEASEGCFSIVTGTDFQSSDNFLIGLGQFDDEGTVVPVATVSLLLCHLNSSLRRIHIDSRRPEHYHSS